MVQPATPPLLTVQLFGSFHAEQNGMPLPHLRLREGERLLAYLILHPNQPVTSKELAQRFWPFEAQTNGAGQGDFPNVRQALRSLRQVLGPAADRLTRPQRATVQLDLTGIEVDFYCFDRLARMQEESAWPAASAEAVALYKGPLLAGWNEPWLTDPRKKCQRNYEALLRRLIEHAERLGKADAVARWAELLLKERPDDEALRLRVGAAIPTSREPYETIEAKLGSGAQSATPEAETLPLEVAGGAVPLVSSFYIERDVDHALQAALARRDSIVLLKGARQVGKTSLLARGVQMARQTDARIVLTDFQKINNTMFASPDMLYRNLAASIASQLGIAVAPRDIWDDDFGPNLNFERFLQLQILPAIPQPVVWAMDEVDRLLACPFGSEVFGLFRSWYNERSLNPDGVLARLTLVIAYATEAHLFITDLNQSPFNVGTRLNLTDFTLQETSELNRRYRSPLKSEQLGTLYAMLAGQPYLTRRTLDQVASGVSLADVLAKAGDEDGLFGDHLRRLWLSLRRSPDLKDALHGLVTGKSRLTPDDFYRLRTAGILAGNTAHVATFRCRLYEMYFARQFELDEQIG